MWGKVRLSQGFGVLLYRQHVSCSGRSPLSREHFKEKQTRLGKGGL